VSRSKRGLAAVARRRLHADGHFHRGDPHLVFNHTRGSLLLAMLAHSSVNTAQLVVVNELFPSAASTEVNALLGSAGVALVLIMMTRGRLGYRGGEVVVLPVIAPDVGSACPEDRP
jgi:hypothetical protein